ncbi:LysM peptidoglycan-binding domain-containing protein [Fructilactobacillus myrtifloralis]|uniref:LysM peptidoglycan-binding domain-containing protein n=1 Tax=Fructilactobacillus myrtifloralis TaxID=2940301 RepID=A0ABY5BQ38_9LACO|nr:LysM domain-containing protein [Fructilactobacillus myrtifloralis]USS85375.1 LysM peptidoglycan-binding domain-containing protein [Fructilactobacillus myrtifloralis]
MDKQEKPQEPWDQSFDGKPSQTSTNQKATPASSRMARRKRQGNIKVIVTILASVVVLIALFALAFGMSKQGDLNSSAKPATAKQTKPAKHKKAAKKQSKPAKKSATKQTDSTADQADQTGDTTASSANAAQSDDQTAQNKQPAAATTANGSEPAKATTATATTSQQSQATNQAAPKDYVVVQQHEGIYRVAKNAGISMQELERLNGLTSQSVIVPGQKLRIR